MINKNIKDLTIKDIEQLRENAIEEGKKIDYKETIHLDDKEKRREFAADITSFANTIGGDLIVGVKENEGVITELSGIEVDDKDKFKLKIENLLRDIVSPRLIGIQSEFYKLDGNNKYIFHVRVPQSYSGPHIVQKRQFFGRHSGGKAPLDYTEIKQRFLSSNQVQKNIRNFHIDRMMKVKMNEGYRPINEAYYSSILLHVIPVQSFNEEIYLFNLNHHSLNSNFTPLVPKDAHNPYIQFDGIGSEGSTLIGYNHLHRQGFTETFDTYVIDKHISSVEVIKGESIVSRLVETASTNIESLKKLNLYGPYLIFTSFLNIKERRLEYGSNSPFPPSSIINQNDFVFPPVNLNDETEIETYQITLEELLTNSVGMVYKNPKFND